MTEWIWIPKWETYQHYKPNAQRGPKWIKQETAQLQDDRYLALTPKERSVLHDIRIAFASCRHRVSNDTRTLSQLCAQRVTNQTLASLNHAGLIEFVSRETLERRLDLLYSRSRSKEVEAEEERSKATAFRITGGQLPYGRELHIARLLEWIGNSVDERTAAVIRHRASGLPESSLVKIEESIAAANGVKNRAGYIVNALKSEQLERANNDDIQLPKSEAAA